MKVPFEPNSSAESVASSVRRSKRNATAAFHSHPRDERFPKRLEIIPSIMITVVDLTNSPNKSGTEDASIVPGEQAVGIISLLESSDEENEEDRKPAAKQNSYGGSASMNKQSINDSEYSDLKIIDLDSVIQLPPTETLQVARIEPPRTFASSARSNFFVESVERDLTHEKKQEIYSDARRPEKLLKDDLDHLQLQLNNIPKHHGDEWNVCQNEIARVTDELNRARQNAAQDIYNRNNSAGSMGNIDGGGRLSIDFHSLYVREAVTKYDEIVLPVLPVQLEVVVITGKGNHSKSRKSTLKAGLIAHVERTNEYKTKQVQYHIDKKNAGKLIFRWVSKKAELND